jgi:RNA-splicing ligase RtcB
MLDVSEAPSAYKDIISVIEEQKDLVKPVHKLTTMINWKDIGEDD